jgi:hypothetical protein
LECVYLGTKLVNRFSIFIDFSLDKWQELDRDDSTDLARKTVISEPDVKLASAVLAAEIERSEDRNEKRGSIDRVAKLLFPLVTWFDIVSILKNLQFVIPRVRLHLNF